MKKYIILTICSITILFAQSQPKLQLGELRFLLGNKMITMNNIVFGIEKVSKNSNTYRVSIGGEDKISKQEFILQATLKAKKKVKEVFLELNTSNMNIIFKRAYGKGFILYPYYHLAMNKGLKNFYQKDDPRREEKDDDDNVSLQSKIRSGKGVIVNKAMEGSVFTVRLVPIYAKNRIVELQGFFSGLVGAKATQNGRSLQIRNGFFRAEVLNEK